MSGSKVPGMTAAYNGVSNKQSVAIVERAIMKSKPLKTAGLHDGNVRSSEMLDICRTIIILAAIYGIDLMVQCSMLQKAWDELEKKILILAIRRFSPPRRQQLCGIMRLQSLDQLKGERLSSLGKRLKAQAQSLPENCKAQRVRKLRKKVMDKLKSPMGWTRKRVREVWHEYKRNLNREAPKWTHSRKIPAL